MWPPCSINNGGISFMDTNTVERIRTLASFIKNLEEISKFEVISKYKGYTEHDASKSDRLKGLGMDLIIPEEFNSYETKVLADSMSKALAEIFAPTIDKARKKLIELSQC